MNSSLVVALALAASSASKLGVHVNAPQDSAALTLLNACPRVAKWLAGPSVPGALADFRGRCPQSITVLRVPVSLSSPYSLTTAGVAAADDFWSQMQGGLAGIDPRTVDWLEGPNEFEVVPDWTRDATSADWFAAFWAKLADRMNAAGYHPLVGSIAARSPPLASDPGSGSTNRFKPTTDAMKKKTYRWGWSYHAYSRDLLTDARAEAGLSLRYRGIRDDCSLAGIPLVLSEGGQGLPNGWQTRGTPADTYLDWLEWFDAQLQQDPDVLGVAVFQVGDRGAYAGFDLGPLAASLAEYLRTVTFPDMPDAGRGDGGPADTGSGSQTTDPPPTSPRLPDGGILPEPPWTRTWSRGCGTSGAALPPLALFALVALLGRWRVGAGTGRQNRSP